MSPPRGFFPSTDRRQLHKRKCQCDGCVKARVAKLLPFQHGTLSAHSMGCRCEKCLATKRKYDADRYAKRKAAEIHRSTVSEAPSGAGPTVAQE